jgi:hypothetical protein
MPKEKILTKEQAIAKGRNLWVTKKTQTEPLRKKGSYDA